MCCSQPADVEWEASSDDSCDVTCASSVQSDVEDSGMHVEFYTV